MDSARAQFGSLLEWILAALFIAGILAIGSIGVREFHTVSAATPVIADEAPPLPDPPATVPPGAVSVPVVLLASGLEIHVGDDEAEVASRLGRDAEVASPSLDRTPAGVRMTRFYEQNGMRFVVVLEPFAGDGQVKVVAIYLQ